MLYAFYCIVIKSSSKTDVNTRNGALKAVGIDLLMVFFIAIALIFGA